MPYIMMKSNLQKMYITYDDYWHEEWGDQFNTLTPFLTGKKINPQFLPKTGYVSDGTIELVPFLADPFWLCSREVKAVIEQLEPDVHAFTPFTLRNSKQGEVIAEYYILNICNSIESLDIKRSDPNVIRLHDQRRPDGSLIGQLDRMTMYYYSNKIVIRRKAILDTHLWVDKICAESDKPFISDRLYEALQPYNLKNYVEFYRTA